MDFPVVFRSHGGRAAAVSSGDLHIDVAFLGAPSCDPYGNANGYSRDGEDGIACGSLGYARTDAEYADQVVVITNHLVPYPNAPWAIPEHDVDYVVVTDDIGDSKGIMSGATRYTKDPKELLIAKTAANVIEAAGYLYDGFSMQMGSGSCGRRCWTGICAAASPWVALLGRLQPCMRRDSLTGFWMCRALTWMRPNL